MELASDSLSAKLFLLSTPRSTSDLRKAGIESTPPPLHTASTLVKAVSSFIMIAGRDTCKPDRRSSNRLRWVVCARWAGGDLRSSMSVCRTGHAT